MACSMTAFERRELSADWGRLAWELRSVNHRYLDITPRLPEDLRQLETAVRERLGRRLSRGKVECSLRFQSRAAVSAVQINWPQAEALVAAAEELEQRFPVSGQLSAEGLLRTPGVLSEQSPDLEPVIEAALALLDQTIDGFIVAREREGAALADMIRSRAERVAELAEQARALVPQIRQRLRERLEARLAELEQAPDANRIEQELVLMAQRLDVDEELDRLVMHVEEIGRVLRRREPIGRRLDFLMQELNREANTLGSKAAAIDTTQVSVEIKVLIEQMREQIQNLE